jgi:hypothetical protein
MDRKDKGNPYLDCYTFYSDNTFVYQYDEEVVEGSFSLFENYITLKVEERFFAGEKLNDVEEPIEFQLSIDKNKNIIYYYGNGKQVIYLPESQQNYGQRDGGF